MGNVNLPTPVALAGGAICVLGGYLLGAVLAPDTATRTTAEVASYDPTTSRLCLSGDFYKVHVPRAGHLDGFSGANDADLMAFFVDQADFRYPDALVDARFRWCGLWR